MNDSSPNARHNRVLVVGFDVFGELTSNPAAQLVRAIAPSTQDIADTIIIPTSYERSFQVLAAAIASHRPAAVLIVGYSRRVDGLRLERQAHNLDRATLADVDGVVCSGRTIVSGGPATLRTVVSLDTIAEDLGRLDLKVRRSRDAGGYVCNHLYYQLLYAATQRPTAPCLFVHVGRWEESLDRGTVIGGVELIVRRLSLKRPMD